jgi:hypothetical protein
MDELSYLIIELGIRDAYYNSATLAGKYTNEHRLIGHMPHHVENRFGRMIEEGIFVPVAGQAQHRNYYLSDKGHKAFAEEKFKRLEKVDAERLQKAVSESVLKTNASVSETNESVKATNGSIQELNRISVENFRVQNRIARASVVVAVAAGAIALIALFQGIFAGGKGEVLRQLQETNTTLQEQNKSLTKILQRQVSIDSISAVRSINAHQGK